MAVNENPFVVNTPAASAIEELANTDPVLFPVDLNAMLLLSQAMADGITVSAN